MEKNIVIERKQVNIALSVKAKTLFNIANPTIDEVEALCTLSDNNNGFTNAGVNCFTSQVYIGKNVRWKADSEDEGYEVLIDSIMQKGQGRSNYFFHAIALGRSLGRVISRVRDVRSLKKEVESYSINFFVWPKGKEDLKKAYTIDPKLQANS